MTALPGPLAVAQPVPMPLARLRWPGVLPTVTAVLMTFISLVWAGGGDVGSN